jgi:hypothetical protein
MGMPYRVLSVDIPYTKPRREYGKAYEEVQKNLKESY